MVTTKYKIVLAYDGTDYHGWQIQPAAVTVVSVLQRTFRRIFGEEIVVVGVSRTDAGVHALGQVAHFVSALPIEPSRLMKAWNAALPTSIVIRSIEVVPDRYMVFHDVAQKTYYYNIFLRRPLPPITRFGWQYPYADSVDWEKFARGLQFFVGQHDFTAFCKLDEDKEPVRTVDAISIRRVSSWKMIQVVIQGRSFLRYQIRRMVGYTLDVARRDNLPIDYIRTALESRDPQQSLLQAESKGLCLRKVIYHDGTG